jgi:hypothetical protein
VEKVLKTRTTSSKGYEKVFRVVVGGSGTHLISPWLIAADKTRLKDITIMIERTVDEPNLLPLS